MHVCASLICVPSLVEASASAFSFNFHQFISRAGVERYNYNRRISCHKFVRNAFTNDVPNLLDVAGVEDLKFNFLVPDFCPSITLYDDCVLLTVGVVVRSECGSKLEVQKSMPNEWPLEIPYRLWLWVMLPRRKVRCCPEAAPSIS